MVVEGLMAPNRRHLGGYVGRTPTRLGGREGIRPARAVRTDCLGWLRPVGAVSTRQPGPPLPVREGRLADPERTHIGCPSTKGFAMLLGTPESLTILIVGLLILGGLLVLVPLTLVQREESGRSQHRRRPRPTAIRGRQPLAVPASWAGASHCARTSADAERRAMVHMPR